MANVRYYLTTSKATDFEPEAVPQCPSEASCADEASLALLYPYIRSQKLMSMWVSLLDG